MQIGFLFPLPSRLRHRVWYTGKGELEDKHSSRLTAFCLMDRSEGNSLRCLIREDLLDATDDLIATGVSRIVASQRRREHLQAFVAEDGVGKRTDRRATR